MDHFVAGSPGTVSRVFRPTKMRVFLCTALAASAYFVPQKIPLEYYPLNDPGADINYLEITCATDKPGELQIFYDLTNGINELNSIRFPLSPTTENYAYTFPLPDAPIVDLRIDPPGNGTTLAIAQVRIINRRGIEIQRFTRDRIQPFHQIAAINSAPDGLTIVSTSASTDPFAHLRLSSPVIPVGMNHRNALRCLFSTGYLATMLWILLLAVLFVFYRPPSWREAMKPTVFMLYLAVIFALVGNRGLIRNSLHYRSFSAPAITAGLWLEIDLNTDSPSNTQLFWDTGGGISEQDSIRREHEPHQGLQTLRFSLPDQALQALRFDPREGGGLLTIRGLRIVDAGGHTRAVLPLDALRAGNDISRLAVERDGLTVETQADATDPILLFEDEQITAINRLRNTSERP